MTKTNRSNSPEWESGYLDDRRKNRSRNRNKDLERLAYNTDIDDDELLEYYDEEEFEKFTKHGKGTK